MHPPLELLTGSVIPESVIGLAVSNPNVTPVAVRIALPGAMLVLLFFTLSVAVLEQRTWNAQTASASHSLTNGGIESIPFVFPFEYSPRVQELIDFQWPAFAVAGIVAPVPQIFHAERKPVPLTRSSYLAMTIAIGLYWFALAFWMDTRLLQCKRPTHSKMVRVALAAILALTAPLFLVFLGRDLLAGWQEGPHGAYGMTAWLALAATILLTELGALRRRRGTANEPWENEIPWHG
jgi:hypothetical protein